MLSHGLSLSRVCALLHSLLFESWILLLSYKEKWSCNTDLPKSCNTVCPRPESCDALRALMSVAPNFCCDETKNRGTYTCVTIGEGNGNPLQYSCLENPRMGDPGACSPWGHKESDMTGRFK